MHSILYACRRFVGGGAGDTAFSVCFKGLWVVVLEEALHFACIWKDCGRGAGGNKRDVCFERLWVVVPEALHFTCIAIVCRRWCRMHMHFEWLVRACWRDRLCVYFEVRMAVLRSKTCFLKASGA